MKKLFTVIALSALASNVFAGSLNLDARMDADSTDYNETNGNPDSGRFNMNTLRLDYKGKINEELSFRVRTRFNSDFGAVQKNDGLNKIVDYAYMTHKLSDSMALTLGKLATDMAGFEGLVPTPDHYLKSTAYSAVSLYATGFKFGYTSDMFDLNLLATNDIGADSTSGTKSNQTRFTSGAIAKFKLMNNSLMPMVSYHTSSAGTGSERTQTYMTAGLKYKMDEMTVDFDYNMFTYVNEDGDDKDDTTNSMVLAYGQKFGAFKPVLKFEMTTNTDKSVGSEVKTNITGIGAALEYYPIEGSDFRYHVAYTTLSSKADTAGAQASTETHMLAGFRINADFLK